MSMAWRLLRKTLRHLNSVDKLKLRAAGVDLCGWTSTWTKKQTAGLTAQREADEQVSS